MSKNKIEQNELDSINGGAENTKAPIDDGLTVPVPDEYLLDIAGNDNGGIAPLGKVF